ncbi:ATP-binding protein [Caballeronia sp. dw_276]|uniref:GAF domain-containing hybrid sensor histidine kinase/response regulator n=1 Tax=Caballeronia sp. dw_276 TaxID=2719795 RepID=UPI001BD33009|nr:ATP-binding protein [Caballeronia sp. dw_276]
MQIASLLPNEPLRIEALERIGVLDTLPEDAYNDIVALAVRICEVPIALISLIDRERQWFKACIGLDVTETSRDVAFCAHAIRTPDDLFIVEDALSDTRFCDNPLVVGGPRIRFYAGAPIVTREGHALGTVCVIDTVPRSLSADQKNALKALARQTASLLQLRLMDIERAEQTKSLREKIMDALADDEREHDKLRQKQRVALIGQLTSGVAHDFNNLLQSVSVSLQLIERKSENAVAVRRYAAGGLQSVERGAKLIAQLLAFSRDELPVLRPINVSACIRDMKELLSRVLGTAARLNFDLENEGVIVICDGTQLEAAVLNVVINARDAMPDGGDIYVTTRIRSVTCDPNVSDGPYLEVRIADTGAGMPYSVASRIFEPFYSTKGDKGTGLGLSQVFAFSVRAGGAASVETAIDKGTAIIMLLKPTSGAESSTEFDPQALASTAQGLKQSHVLIVDENIDTQHYLVDLLSDAGYSVRSARSASAALYAVEQHVPDAVIANYSMQGLSAASLTIVMREADPQMPLIFMTGRSDIAEVKAKLPGGVMVLQKPFQFQTLVDVLEDAIVKRGSI